MPPGVERGPVRRIGLTGGIGSGKTTVGSLLERQGAHLVDTDAIARELSAPGGAAIEALRAAFGDQAIDATGALDRARMRALAFADPLARSRLEGILHPLIAAETARRAQTAGDAVIVFDVPLLVESRQWRSRVDRILVVDCSEATQAERVICRAGWDAAVVQAVIAQQAGRALRRACADAVIFNDGIGLEELAQEVHSLWQQWCAPR